MTRTLTARILAVAVVPLSMILALAAPAPVATAVPVPQVTPLGLLLTAADATVEAARPHGITVLRSTNDPTTGASSVRMEIDPDGRRFRTPGHVIFGGLRHRHFVRADRWIPEFSTSRSRADKLDAAVLRHLSIAPQNWVVWSDRGGTHELANPGVLAQRLAPLAIEARKLDADTIELTVPGPEFLRAVFEGRRADPASPVRVIFSLQSGKVSRSHFTIGSGGLSQTQTVLTYESPSIKAPPETLQIGRRRTLRLILAYEAREWHQENVQVLRQLLRPRTTVAELRSLGGARRGKVFQSATGIRTRLRFNDANATLGIETKVYGIAWQSTARVVGSRLRVSPLALSFERPGQSS